MDRDGCSLITFFQKCREYDDTILVIEDEDGWKFGAYCKEPWAAKFCFFGNGEQFLYTFKDENDPNIFTWCDGDQHMYATDKCIALAGSR